MTTEGRRSAGSARQGELRQVDISRRTGQSTGSRQAAGRQGVAAGQTRRTAAQQAALRKKRRRRKRRQAILRLVLVLIVALAAALGILYGRVKTSATAEAGSDVEPAALVRYGGVPTVTEGLTQEQKSTPGTYTIKVKLAPFTYKVEVTVQDTVAPSAEGLEVYGMYGESIAPESFVTDIQDGTDVTVSFMSEPDFSQPGEQTVELLLRDEGNNLTKVEAGLYISNLMQELTLEAGSPVPKAKDFLEAIEGFEETQVSFVTDMSAVDMSILGTQEIKVLLDDREFTTRLTVVDTVAPEITVQSVDGWTGKGISPEEFVKEVKDVTAVTYAYAQEPDWSKEGSGSAELVATDGAGNSTRQTVSYTLKADTVPPEVSLSVIDIIIGEPVSYKKAAIFSDNCDKKDELTLTVDNSKVDPGTVGEYEVTYTVTDTAGNSTTKTGKVKVLAEKPIYYDEELVNQKADEVLDEILKDGMTQLEQARAIYNWVHSKIGYISHSEKGDWVRGAYEGLVDRQGDCFVYAATARLLLTRAGIPNIDIVKSAVNPTHYWSLVDVGEGWYHFDATPRKDKTVFFMWTDEQLREYSESHKNSHIYDASLYPEIN